MHKTLKKNLNLVFVLGIISLFNSNILGMIHHGLPAAITDVRTERKIANITDVVIDTIIAKVFNDLIIQKQDLSLLSETL